MTNSSATLSTVERFLISKKKVMFSFTFLISLGFLAISYFSYNASKTLMREQITHSDLPLTSDNIYSEIQRDLLRPIFISSLMAHNTFLSDWVMEGELDTDQISKFLEEIKNKYNTFSSFFVSEESGNYYYPGGILKKISREDPRDSWYVRVRDMKDEYEVNVDVDLANNDNWTIFINYKVYNQRGLFLGVTGVGLAINSVKKLMQSYQDRYFRRVYLVSPQGEITVKSPTLRFPVQSVFEIPNSRKALEKILVNRSVGTHLQYQVESATVHLHSRYIPEFNWYLFVEAGEDTVMGVVRKTFVVNIIICLVIAGLVLFLTNWLVSGYQARLERQATTDKLTGLFNRQAFEMFFQQLLKTQKRKYLPFTLLSIDVDLFKHINDFHGHPTGDIVLQEVSQVIRATIREGDIFCRWGGDEFLLLLEQCELEQGCSVADSICRKIREYRCQQCAPPLPVSVSIGVTQSEAEEDEKRLFDRVDKALYLAKENGRDRYEAVKAEKESLQSSF